MLLWLSPESAIQQRWSDSPTHVKGISVVRSHMEKCNKGCYWGKSQCDDREGLARSIRPDLENSIVGLGCRLE